MRIAIEAQRIFRNKKHGMDFVALESIRQLQRIDKENEYFIIVGPGGDHCLEESDNFHIVEVGGTFYPLWEQVSLPRALRKIKPDFLHCTSNTAPVYCPVPLILTLHDIIFLEKRASSNKSMYQNMGWHYRRLVVPKILKKCLKVITVSKFERDRIASFLGMSDNVICYNHNGVGEHFAPVKNHDKTTCKYLLESRYIFFLGNTDPKKNVPNTLKAYAEYLEKSTVKRVLLIADLSECAVDEVLRQHGIEQIKPYIRFVGYIPNKHLPAIYTGADIFLYTSLRESFGIPILESMSCGSALITSDTSAMPEIAGEGAALVSPTDSSAIASKMLEIEQNREYRDSLVNYGFERVKHFTWRDSAQRLLEIYRSVGK